MPSNVMLHPFRRLNQWVALHRVRRRYPWWPEWGQADEIRRERWRVRRALRYATHSHISWLRRRLGPASSQRLALTLAAVIAVAIASIVGALSFLVPVPFLGLQSVTAVTQGVAGATVAGATVAGPMSRPHHAAGRSPDGAAVAGDVAITSPTGSTARPAPRPPAGPTARPSSAPSRPTTDPSNDSSASSASSPTPSTSSSDPPSTTPIPTPTPLPSVPPPPSPPVPTPSLPPLPTPTISLPPVPSLPPLPLP